MIDPAVLHFLGSLAFAGGFLVAIFSAIALGAALAQVYAVRLAWLTRKNALYRPRQTANFCWLILFLSILVVVIARLAA